MGKATVRPLTLREYQTKVDSTDERKRLLVSLLGLIGEIGDIQTVLKRRLELRGYPRFSQDLAEEIGDTLWYLASLASRQGLSLETIALENVAKAESLHSQGKLCRFDKTYPKHERFPRQFKVTFSERSVGTGVRVTITVNGVIVGDALTDNANKDDGYRYHDAFHLAYAAILGWSPVVRALLHLKRKSDPQVDEVQDGARAKVVEEAISLFLFNQAKARDDYREKNSIDVSLLKTIQKLCGDLEVRICTAKQWQIAIFKGYEIFRSLRENHGGHVALDLDKPDIVYSPLTKPSQRTRHARAKSTRLPRSVASRRKAARSKSR